MAEARLPEVSGVISRTEVARTVDAIAAVQQAEIGRAHV